MKFMARIQAFFLKEEGGKEVLDQKKFFGAIGVALLTGILVILFSNASGDSSVIVSSVKPIEAGNVDETKTSLPVSQKVSGMLKASEQHVRIALPKKQAKHTGKKIKYRAPQVIERKDSFASKLPLGTNLIGKLLTSIDTRESEQLYKVLLPYGGKGKHGEGIPKNTVLFGTVTYPNTRQEGIHAVLERHCRLMARRLS